MTPSRPYRAPQAPADECNEPARDRGGLVLSDEDLMAEVARGSQAALRDLYARHIAQLRIAAFRILKHGEDAEDLAHDVFMDAWFQATRYDAQRGSLRAWLTVQVRCRAWDRIRATSTAQRHAWKWLETELLAAAASGASGYDDSLLPHAALRTLSFEQSAVLYLSYFRGLTHREIASGYGIPIGTIKSRLASALGILRDQLQVGSG